MKIVVVANRYDAFVRGLGDALADFCDEVGVLIPNWRPLGVPGLRLRVFKNVEGAFAGGKANVWIRRVPAVSPIPWLAARRLTRELRAVMPEPDAILSHFLVPYGLVGNAVSRMMGASSTVIAHGFDAYDFPFRNRLFGMIARSILRGADNVITVSHRNAACLRRAGYEGPLAVIPNGFDAAVFRPRDRPTCRAELGMESTGAQLLAVGNLIDIKNHETLIRAVQRLVDSQRDVRLAIVGDGPLRPRLLKLVSDLGLESRVALPGSVGPEQVARRMNAADLFILPSLNEGSPCVVYEALACGTPVVASNVGGIPEVVSSTQLGMLVREPRDGVELARVVEAALARTWNREEIVRGVAHLTWQNAAQQVFDVLSSTRQSRLKTCAGSPG